MRLRSRHGGERGSAALEFALLLPILFLVLLAVVQVGAIGRDRLLLSQAARAGVREAAVQDSEDAVTLAVRAGAPGLDPARLRIAVARTGPRGSPVTVSLEYDVVIAGALAGWLLPDAVTLRTAATARQEFG